MSRLALSPSWLRPLRTCALCGSRTEGRRTLCEPCEADLPWLEGHCLTCAVPLPAQGLICGGCQQRPPAFSRVEVPWRYAFPVDSLINRFKHQAQWPYGKVLAGLLQHHLSKAFAQGLPRPDALLPVPLATRRLRERGFNQAGMLADWLGPRLDLPVRPDWLQRPQHAAAQQELDAAARRRNLRQAFSLSPTARPQGAHLALVDDVVTTGSTADVLARLLLKAGARRVDVYCLARTPRPGD